MAEHPVNRLVCPECYWQVRFVRGDLRTYFKHDSLTGNGRWKSCSRYKAGEHGGGDGGWHLPTWHVDDHPTIHQVLNGFVIHTLAKEHGWLGSDSVPYNACLDEARPYRLRPENRWADLIEESADRPRWNTGATVAELVFVRYLTGTADTRPEPPTPYVTTPFRQVMALAWAAAGNRMRAVVDLLRDAGADDAEMATGERMLEVLTAPGGPDQRVGRPRAPRAGLARPAAGRGRNLRRGRRAVHHRFHRPVGAGGLVSAGGDQGDGDRSLAD